MTKLRLIILSVLTLQIYSGCSSSQKTTSNDPDVVLEDTVIVEWEHDETLEQSDKVYPDPKNYQASHERVMDLLHTRLEVRPDWEKRYLYGKAFLTFKPYFYPADTLVLDAKGFNIHKVSLVEKGKITDLQYAYDSLQLNIKLNKLYSRKDTFQIFIDYTAKPYELPSGGSFAITEDRGLYFVNADGADPDKPRQIWTQGETEASSAWFPTIDKPNESTTQEIFITVADTLVTLSNGILKEVKNNNNGTKTWYWNMAKPHAPYLFMIAIGDFAIVKDKWRNVEVDYYVEPEFEPYAKNIFGNTPEMLEFYSNILKFPYPWPKYAQIVVRDFVSGAMENTTATVHFEGLQRTNRELLDETYEDIIAHEVAHQWFGDIVTTESWTNIPLNEAFATYGEYLWFEHKYGRNKADYHLEKDRMTYWAEAESKQVSLIRYYYEDKEHMFDAHSYQKGGAVLHMLRKYVGDEAFFAALNIYLERNKYQPVEIHQLRLAFEEVTGRDLNIFFNQWFMEPGHPVITVDHEYDQFSDESIVKISQKHSLSDNMLYILPVAIDVYKNGTVERYLKTIDEYTEAFHFPGKADLINFDAENMLLAEITENKSTEAYIFEYKNSPLYQDRMDAVIYLSALQDFAPAKEVIFEALSDTFFAIRKFAVEKIEFEDEDIAIINKLKELALNDADSKVRAAALIQLYGTQNQAYESVMVKALSDSSYLAQGEALYGLYVLNPKQALRYAKDFENEKNINIVLSLADIYSNHGGPEKNDYFLKKLKELRSWNKYTLITYYANYLTRMDDLDLVKSGFSTLKDIAINEPEWLFRYNAKKSMDRLLENYILLLSELKINDPDGKFTKDIQQLVNDVKAMIEEVKQKETNETLKKIYMLKDDS